MKEHNKKISDLQKRQADYKADIDSDVEKASQICERLKTRRSSSNLTSEITNIENLYAHRQPTPHRPTLSGVIPELVDPNPWPTLRDAPKRALLRVRLPPIYQATTSSSNVRIFKIGACFFWRRFGGASRAFWDRCKGLGAGFGCDG